MHRTSIFVNPTFETDPVTLSRKPAQIFFRRMRKAGLKFSYFGCGEYGENRLRPHYHIILFGLDFAEDRYPWKRHKGNLYYRSPTLEKFWPDGQILFTEFDVKNALYTAGYTVKKLNGPAADEINPETGLKPYERINDAGEIIPVEKEFVMCSLKPAIGKRWLEKNYREIYPADSVAMNGREYAVPRKYDQWLKELDPELYQTVTKQRLDHLKKVGRKSDAQLAYEGAARDAKLKNIIPERT